MSKYGFPYLGSKSKIAKDIVSLFPSCEVFYDLFAGGCAITHAIMEKEQSLDWTPPTRIVANDISGSTQLFFDAIQGEYREEKRWISREQFNAEKSNDPYVRYVWSFSNNGKNYLFSKELEPIKKALHYVVCYGDWSYFDELTIDQIPLKNEYKIHFSKGGDRKEHLRVMNLVSKERPIELEQLQQLEQLQRLQRLEVLHLDYKEVSIKEKNCVVYCDIPYNTGFKDYDVSFNWKEFWEWAESLTVPVFVSEYSYSGNHSEKWQTVYEKEKINLRAIKDGKRKINVEKVFWNGKTPTT